MLFAVDLLRNMSGLAVKFGKKKYPNTLSINFKKSNDCFIPIVNQYFFSI